MRRQNKNFSYSTAFQSAYTLYVRENEPTPEQIAATAAAAAETQRLISEAVAAATAGLKTKNDELLGKMKLANDRVKLFDGMDPEEIKTLKARLDEDEDVKLFGEGKKNVVIEKYTERMRASHLEELKAEQAKTAAESKRADTYRGAVLEGQILSVTSGLHKGAVEDALLHARNIFSLDANGKAVKVVDGRVELGKDGATPFGPAEWIEQQKELKPHWFPASTSGGGGGGPREAGGGQGKTMKRSDFDNLAPAKQAEVARGGTTIVD